MDNFYFWHSFRMIISIYKDINLKFLKIAMKFDYLCELLSVDTMMANEISNGPVLKLKSRYIDSSNWPLWLQPQSIYLIDLYRMVLH